MYAKYIYFVLWKIELNVGKNSMKGVKTRPEERYMPLSTGYNDDMIYTMSNYVIHAMYSKAGTYRYCFK